MSKIIALAIGMRGTFFPHNHPVGEHGIRTQITRVWSETCVNVTSIEGVDCVATSVFVPPMGTPAISLPSGHYFLPDDFVEAATQCQHSPAIQKGIDAVTSTPPCYRPLTFGERAVGIGFNPSGSGAVGYGKAIAAQLIDLAHEQRQASESPEVKRMASLAITSAQEAQMWLTKAQTWKD